MTLTQYQLS